MAAAITFLVPNTTPAYLIKNFTKQQRELLLELLNSAALTSSLTQIEGMEELMPFITSNPADALQIYKKVLTTWGKSAFKKLLQKSLQAVFSMLPPLGMAEMAGMKPGSISPASFHKMQEDYIALMREIYSNAANQHGPAWAAEYCTAFADLLPMALIGASANPVDYIKPETANTIVYMNSFCAYFEGEKKNLHGENIDNDINECKNWEPVANIRIWIGSLSNV